MKHPFLKSALVISAALALMNCGDEDIATSLPNIPNQSGQVVIQGNNTIINPDGSTTTIDVSAPCWVIQTEQGYLLIGTDNVVSDANGNPIGSYDPTTQAITDASGNTTAMGVDVSVLPVLTPSTTPNNPNVPTTPDVPANSSASIVPTTPASSAIVTPPVSSSSIGNGNNQQTQPIASSSSVNNQNQQASSSSKQQDNNQQQQQSSSSQQNNQQQGGQGTCLDKVSNKNVKPYDNLTGKNGESYAYKEDCSINCYYDPAGKNCASIGTSTGNNQQQQQSSSSQQQQQQKSSSSQQQPKSSSSQQQWQPSSSSQQQNNQQQGGASLLPKIIDNNKKTGYATRYWDSCKPHCAWEGKGGPVARTCNADGMSKASSGASSVCDGGNAGTCFDQTPQIVNDTIAYAFAATPGGGNDCGKCYMLTFKGTGASATNTPTDDHHRKIKGKHLIVMSSNIGYDVSHNQFDLMIPGGGPGAFNGCGKMGISCAGAQYGGFLTTCNYDKSCLIKMCNSEYSNESLRNGCLFLANWMEAANNPEIEFVQVECPAALAAKY
ncbi:MAG: glycosyl hydrolase family 5 [Fibrobacter sp.]|nr:glycosyl hydrolase family 5 [Fibrobacter sp.]